MPYNYKKLFSVKKSNLLSSNTFKEYKYTL